MDSDEVGLQKAYSSRSGLYSEGDTLFIAGTRDVTDVASWPSLPFTGRLTKRYADAIQVAPGHNRFVGHSLGGSVAVDLAQDFGGVSVTYGSPLPGQASHANLLDPVALVGSLVSGRLPSDLRVRPGHMLSDYKRI
jgi:pimeloyl-ACP methyl ester carboxylesterase